MAALPDGWAPATINELVGLGVFTDGDWVETKDQDPDGEVRLTQLADVGDGEYRDRSARFLTSQKAEQLSCTFLRPGDIMIARMPDPLGRACIFPGDTRPSVTVVDVCVVRGVQNNFDHRWLMHFLNSPALRSAISGLRSGSTRQRISRGKLATLELPVPPLAEQRRIVAAIEEQFARLDAGVTALERARANLKRYRASVLKAAVEGRLTEGWREANPDAESGSALLERILNERRARWEEAQLKKYEEAGKTPPKNWRSKYKEPAAPDTTDLPKLTGGWVWASLPQIGQFDRGKSKHRPRNAPYLYGGPYPFIQTGDVRHAGTFIKEYGQTYSEAGLLQSKLWPAGTLCITIAANIAETGILSFEACFPDSVVGFIAPGEWVSTRYVEIYLRTIRENLEIYAPATAQKNINIETLKRVAVALPPLAEQEEIVAEVERRLSVVDEVGAQVEANLQRAARLRQAILKRAFEGKLVPQDPTDEPASALLERIRQERERSAAEKPKRKKLGKRSPKGEQVSLFATGEG